MGKSPAANNPLSILKQHKLIIGLGKAPKEHRARYHQPQDALSSFLPATTPPFHILITAATRKRRTKIITPTVADCSAIHAHILTPTKRSPSIRTMVRSNVPKSPHPMLQSLPFSPGHCKRLDHSMNYHHRHLLQTF